MKGWNMWQKKPETLWAQSQSVTAPDYEIPTFDDGSVMAAYEAGTLIRDNDGNLWLVNIITGIGTRVKFDGSKEG